MADDEIKRVDRKSSDKKSTQDFLENINATIYRLNLLCNRFEKDKDTMLKEGAELKNAITTIQDEIASLAKVKLDLVDRMTKIFIGAPKL